MSAGVFMLQSADVKTVMQELDKVDRRPRDEPAGRHPADHPDRAHERAARHHAAARVPRRGEEVDRAPRPGRRRRRSALLRLQPAEPARGKARAAAAAGVHRARASRGAARRADARAGHAGRERSSSRRRSRRRRRRPRRRRHRRDTATPAAAGGRRLPAVRRRDGIGVVRNIQVVADKDNNTLLIVATPLEYAVIEAALKKLDIPPRQVMIEVTIAEVDAERRDRLRRRWLFKGGAPSGRGSGGNPHSSACVQPGGSRRTVERSGESGARARAGLRLHHQQRELSRRDPGGAAPARHLRQHQGHRQPAPGRARQPEGDDQGGRPDPDQPADARRRHDQRAWSRRRRSTSTPAC